MIVNPINMYLFCKTHKDTFFWHLAQLDILDFNLILMLIKKFVLDSLGIGGRK